MVPNNAMDERAFDCHVQKAAGKPQYTFINNPLYLSEKQ
ncbi:unnamed protein product [Acidithrix sp. C25]|nr:unnamed protein product [Acidithrix sp. C25]